MRKCHDCNAELEDYEGDYCDKCEEEYERYLEQREKRIESMERAWEQYEMSLAEGQKELYFMETQGTA